VPAPQEETQLLVVVSQQKQPGVPPLPQVPSDLVHWIGLKLPKQLPREQQFPAPQEETQLLVVVSQQKQPGVPPLPQVPSDLMHMRGLLAVTHMLDPVSKHVPDGHVPDQPGCEHISTGATTASIPRMSRLVILALLVGL
jgi:hypothetical protein